MRLAAKRRATQKPVMRKKPAAAEKAGEQPASQAEGAEDQATEEPLAENRMPEQIPAPGQGSASPGELGDALCDLVLHPDADLFLSMVHPAFLDIMVQDLRAADPEPDSDEPATFEELRTYIQAWMTEGPESANCEIKGLWNSMPATRHRPASSATSSARPRKNADNCQ